MTRNERVVDADAESDHAADLRRPARNLDEVSDQRHRADAEHETEQGHPDRQPHRDQRPERDEQHDHRDEQADHLTGSRLGLVEGEEQVTAGFDLQRRVDSSVGDGVEQPVEIGHVELVEHRILERHDSDSAVSGDPVGGERIADAEDVRQLREIGTDVRDLGSRNRGVENRSGVERARHDTCGETRAVRSRCAEQFDGLLGVDAGHLERILEIAAERRGRRNHRDRNDEPRSDHAPGALCGGVADSIQDG